jgi:hypothetical protein
MIPENNFPNALDSLDEKSSDASLIAGMKYTFPKMPLATDFNPRKLDSSSS